MIYQLFANQLNGISLALLLVAFPFVFVVSAWLGRKVQRKYWMLDQPYEERIKYFVKVKRA